MPQICHIVRLSNQQRCVTQLVLWCQPDCICELLRKLPWMWLGLTPKTATKAFLSWRLPAPDLKVICVTFFFSPNCKTVEWTARLQEGHFIHFLCCLKLLLVFFFVWCWEESWSWVSVQDHFLIGVWPRLLWCQCQGLWCQTERRHTHTDRQPHPLIAEAEPSSRRLPCVTQRLLPGVRAC